MLCLFLGGDSDGDWADVAVTHQYIKRKCKMEHPVLMVGGLEGFSPYMKYEVYRRQRYEDGDNTYYVYLLESIPVNMLFHMLLAGYKRK